MRALLVRWANAMRVLDPRFVVQVPDTTRFSAGGVAAALVGKANCISFAREPFPSEIVAFKRIGHPLIVIPVARGSFATPHGTFALAIYVNRANSIHGLTLLQLEKIFAAGASRPSADRLTWGQLGLGGRWATRPVHVYGMEPKRASGNPPGIVNYLDLHVLHGRHWRSNLRIERDSPHRSALAAIVQAVGHDPDGISYSGFGYGTAAVRAVPIARIRGVPYVTGSAAAVATGEYALEREIYLGFPATAAGTLSAPACRVLTYILGQAGQAQIAGGPMRFMALTSVQRGVADGQLRHACRTHIRTGTGAQRSTRPAYFTSTGAIRIVGYNDMRWMLEALDHRFTRLFPGTHFKLILPGTRSAPAALADGTSLFAPMGATFSKSELSAYRRQTGSDPLRFAVAHAALDPRAKSSPLAIFVNRANPLRTIDMRALRLVFTSSGPITWSQLGLRGAWAALAIAPCGLAADTALGRFMRTQLLGKRHYAPGYLGFPESRAVLRHVASDRGALCFADLNQANSHVRVLGIRLAGGYVTTGSRQDIVSGGYPLDRYLYIYVHASDHQGNRLVCRYLRMVLSNAGQQIIGRAHPGYLPLSQRQRTGERKRLSRLLCSAHAAPEAGANEVVPRIRTAG
ncbi:MAG: hypothetical protein EPN38_07955 [Rhodanobacteraceae bacterium]|nr:MAG: hypothetical protein EPN38_07955 [Rhodanobacteraceae bacterium]